MTSAKEEMMEVIKLLAQKGHSKETIKKYVCTDIVEETFKKLGID